MKRTSLWSLSIALLVNLLHFLQQLPHVERVWRSRGRLKELIHELEPKNKHVLQLIMVNSNFTQYLADVSSWN